jgi:hypothetical protein
MGAIPLESADEEFVDKHTFKAFRGRAVTDATVLEVLSRYQAQAEAQDWKLLERLQGDGEAALVYCRQRVMLLLAILDRGEDRSVKLEAAWSCDPSGSRYCSGDDAGRTG